MYENYLIYGRILGTGVYSSLTIFPGCRFKNIDVVKNNCVKTELTVDKEVYIMKSK